MSKYSFLGNFQSELQIKEIWVTEESIQVLGALHILAWTSEKSLCFWALQKWSLLPAVTKSHPTASPLGGTAVSSQPGLLWGTWVGRQLKLLQHLPGESRRELAARNASREMPEPRLADVRCLQRVCWGGSCGQQTYPWRVIWKMGEVGLYRDASAIAFLCTSCAGVPWRCFTWQEYFWKPVGCAHWNNKCIN